MKASNLLLLLATLTFNQCATKLFGNSEGTGSELAKEKVDDKMFIAASPNFVKFANVSKNRQYSFDLLTSIKQKLLSKSVENSDSVDSFEHGWNKNRGKDQDTNVGSNRVLKRRQNEKRRQVLSDGEIGVKNVSDFIYSWEWNETTDAYDDDRNEDYSISGDDDVQEEPVPAPGGGGRRPVRKNPSGASDDKSGDQTSLTLSHWAIVGMAFGVLLVFAIIVIAVVSKLSKPDAAWVTDENHENAVDTETDTKENESAVTALPCVADGSLFSVDRSVIENDATVLASLRSSNSLINRALGVDVKCESPTQ